MIHSLHSTIPCIHFAVYIHNTQCVIYIVLDVESSGSATFGKLYIVSGAMSMQLYGFDVDTNCWFVTIQSAGLFSTPRNLKSNFVSSRTSQYAPGTKFAFRTRSVKKILARLNTFDNITE